MKQKRGASHAAQYERPVTPPDWSADGRRFAEQLSAVLDDIYRRYGRLRMEDMNADTRALIGSLAAKGEVFSIAEAVGLLAEQLNALQAKAATLETRIAQYTAADVLAKLKTVDGSGSGLDADLFKGQATIPLSLGGTGGTTADQAITNIGALPVRLNGGINNCNSIVKSGLYTHDNWQNGPASMPDKQGTLFVIEYKAGSPGWVHQLFLSPHVGTVWKRYVTNGSWATWTILFNG